MSGFFFLLHLTHSLSLKLSLCGVVDLYTHQWLTPDTRTLQGQRTLVHFKETAYFFGYFWYSGRGREERRGGGGSVLRGSIREACTICSLYQNRVFLFKAAGQLCVLRMLVRMMEASIKYRRETSTLYKIRRWIVDQELFAHVCDRLLLRDILHLNLVRSQRKTIKLLKHTACPGEIKIS